MNKTLKITLNLICLVLLLVDAGIYIAEHNYDAAIGWGLAAMWCLSSTLYEYDEL